MNIPLLDLKAQYKSIREEIMAATMEVYQSQRFILGPKVEELEKEIAAYTQARYAIGVSSGTDALLISLMGANIGPGDLVLTSPYTFFSTAGSITRVGAIPVFVDIDSQTYNIDPGKLEKKISTLNTSEKARLKAIVPVHLFGQCADMEDILAIAKSFNLTIIEDAAQAIGAEHGFSDGSSKRAGSMGSYGCFSFFPSKNLGCFGDGGMVITNDEKIYQELMILRVHGSQPKYYHRTIGGNFRLDALQAAILLVKFRYLDQWTEKRRENARIYRELFAHKDLEEIDLPFEKNGRHIYNQFVVKVDKKRDKLKQYLINQGIGCEIYYPVPLHVQECFQYLGYHPKDCPVSIEAAAQTIALPIYSELKYEQIEYIVEKISSFYKDTIGS